MKKLALAYFGTPDFSARLLGAILKDKTLPVDVKVVVTQPDKKVGRKQIITPSPVKLVGQKYHVPVKSSMHDFFSKKREEEKKSTSSGSRVDLVLLFAYGEIIPKELLAVPRYGFWNIHPSLLPKYRGASPVSYPLINGDEETGVTLMQMNEKMDRGPIVVQEKVKILPKERKDELTNRLTDVAFKLFKQAATDLAQGKSITTQKQEEAVASYTKLLTKEDGFIEFQDLKTKITENPEKIFNLFRGLYPWPGIWTQVKVEGQEKRLKLTEMDFDGEKLIIKMVQLEGKKATDFKQFNAAYKIF